MSAGCTLYAMHPADTITNDSIKAWKFTSLNMLSIKPDSIY